MIPENSFNQINQKERAAAQIQDPLQHTKLRAAVSRATQMVATPQRDGCCSKNVDLRGFKTNCDRFC